MTLRRVCVIPALLVVLLSSAGCHDQPPPETDQAAEAVWKEIGTWSGHGNAQLETFPIERFTWRVRWETKNEAPTGAGAFHVTANSGDSGRILADVVDMRGVGKDVEYITELPHRYYLVVTSTGVDWTLTAEEPELEVDVLRSEAAEQRTLLTVFLAGLFFLILIRTAWLGDDAYITFRTVDNFVSGYGMRWNVVERVQTFTHPLWFFVFSAFYFVTHEAYFTAYALTIALSTAAFLIFLRRISATATTALLGGAVLLFTKSFMDYSTSGLENPLYSLFVLFLLAHWRVDDDGRGLTRLWVLGGLIVLNRMDLGLLVAPALVVRSWPYRWRRALRSAAIGLAPLLAWEVFSVVYYGVPFPNTAYAKLQTGVPSGTLMVQGLLYLLDAFSVDPVAPLAMLVSAAMLLALGPRRDWPLLLGIALYFVYIVRVGGDFMTGRFLSVPLLCAVSVWARVPWRIPKEGPAIALAAVAILGIFGTARPPITSGSSTYILNANEGISNSGVADERVFYYRYTGLLRWSRGRTLPWNAQVQRGQELKAAPAVAREVNIGFMEYYAGPGVTIIDEYGLCDPFLARLPAQPDWRIGHYYRPSPPGYVESVQSGRNMLVDPDLALEYEQIRVITRGPIWSNRRWRAILALNFD